MAARLTLFQYGMLAGHLPFEDGLQSDVLANHTGKDLLLLYEYIASTPLAFPKHVSPPAKDLVRRILVVNPSMRIDMVKVARHSWLKEYDFMLGWIYGLFDGATGSNPKPDDDVTAFAGEEQVSPSPARTVQVEYVAPSLLGAAEEGSIEEAF
jgi:serine/threonine protein kinase